MRNCIQISTQFADLSTSNLESNDENAVDHIHEYAKEVMTLSLFYMEYQDSIREGGGNRVFDCFCYLMFIFKATGHRNYAVEVFL